MHTSNTRVSNIPICITLDKSFFFISIQSSSGDLAIQMARKNPDRDVVKPQREGGGEDISNRLNLHNPYSTEKQ